MGIDPLWETNVAPLLDALEHHGLDPIEWAKDHDLDFLKWHPKNFDLILFACGYMQATGNITGMTWEEQMREYLASLS